MKLKEISLITIILLLISILGSNVFAEDLIDKIVDPEIPDEWYEDFKHASQLGITEYNENPIFKEKVEKGEIPPVEERLPDDPPVKFPYKEIGEYGGTVIVWDSEVDGSEFGTITGGGLIRATTPTPDAQGLRNQYIEGIEISEDQTSITINMRKGMKWSNGDPVNADDYVYWYKYFIQNEKLSPVGPEELDPPVEAVTKIDDYTVVIDYGKPVPHIKAEFGRGMGCAFGFRPSEYMKQFHPEFEDINKLEEMAEEVGLNSWDEYYLRVADDSPTHPEYEHQRPVLTPYIVTERTQSDLIAEPNPYYPFVDPEGNQIPYINEIWSNLAESREMISTKAVTGEATFSSRFLDPENIPVYMDNQEKENYTTLIYNDNQSSSVSIHPHMDAPDKKLRSVFGEFNFRKALSLAIDREDINERIFFGYGIPHQTSVLPINELYKEEWGSAYIEYNPEEAEKALDEMGMLDVNDDGYRETPDGEEFNPTLIYCERGLDPTSILELIIGDWDDIGLNIELQQISRELHDTRKDGNNINFGEWSAAQKFGPWTRTQTALRSFAPIARPTYNPWPGWTNYYLSKGEKGVELTEQAEELIELGETVLYSLNEEERLEAQSKLYELQAENLWTIGTVGLTPKPVIIKNNLKTNMPKTGIWGIYGGQFDAETLFLKK